MGCRQSFALSQEAAVLVARQLVQQKVSEPGNIKYRDAMVAMKVNAKFEPTNPRYGAVWETMKRDLKASQATQNNPAGQSTGASATPALTTPQAPSTPPVKP